MATEIERKFLVCGDFRPLAVRSQRMVQGYICATSGKTVRIRVAGDNAWLTIKGPSGANGWSRYEFEQSVPLADAEELLALCEPGIIEKERYYIPAGLRTWEVDVFHGENEGLIVAELELGSEEETFDRPDWLGVEVTGDKRYYNAMLSACPFSLWEKNVDYFENFDCTKTLITQNVIDEINSYLRSLDVSHDILASCVLMLVRRSRDIESKKQIVSKTVSANYIRWIDQRVSDLEIREVTELRVKNSIAEYVNSNIDYYLSHELKTSRKKNVVSLIRTGVFLCKACSDLPFLSRLLCKITEKKRLKPKKDKYNNIVYQTESEYLENPLYVLVEYYKAGRIPNSYTKSDTYYLVNYDGTLTKASSVFYKE